jgi:hypothetical protein
MTFLGKDGAQWKEQRVKHNKNSYLCSSVTKYENQAEICSF